MKLGLCVVGCGDYAQTFAQGIQAILGEIDLYFASRDRQRAEAYSLMFQGSGAFGSYQEAAADSRVEAMYLCTPPLPAPRAGGYGRLGREARPIGKADLHNP